MKLNKTILWAVGGLATVAAIGTLSAPRLSAAIKAAFVEVVIPSKPYYGTMSVAFNLLDTNASKYSVGPDVGTFAVTNITLTNFSQSRQQLFIFAPVFSSGGCGGSGSLIIGGGGPRMTVYVQPNSTQTISYPTPLVFAGIDGHACVAAQITTLGIVEVTVNGFVN